MRDLDWNELREAAQGLTLHIRKTDELLSTLRDVKYTLDRLLASKEHEYAYQAKMVGEQINLLQEQLARGGVPKIDPYNFRYEKAKEAYETDEWPVAIEPAKINLNYEDKQVRAEAIMNLIVRENMQSVKFLDFGCGEGFTTVEAANMGAEVAMGYDPAQNWKFESKDNLVFSPDWGIAWQHAPYDVVLMYDVLDHCANPREALAMVKDILTPGGRVYVRNHPWCGRHGSHLYEQANKAFIHLVFDEIELTRLGGFHSPYSQKVLDPISTYRQWFEEMGYEVEWEIPTEEHVEEFFTSFDNMSIKERITRHWPGQNPADYMKVSFVDYMLRCENSNYKIF